MNAITMQTNSIEQASAEGSNPIVPATERAVSTIEVGWIVAGRLDEADYEAVRTARSAVLNVLNMAFSEFSWRMPLLRRPEMVTGHREEPVLLLEQGVAERETYSLDFGIMLTPVDLISHYKPFALATVSRALDMAAISTARIDPMTDDENITRDERVQLMADRIVALALHALGHLCGLGHTDDRDNVMYDVEAMESLVAMRKLTPPQIEQMRRNLRQIADVRLEEQSAAERPAALPFYLRGAWLNRHEILDAVWQARPWEFPRRLSRLTTAALSAAMLMLMTAETWEMAASQHPGAVAILGLVSLLATTLFIIMRQQLLVRRNSKQLTEQTVITNVSTIGVVLSGMLTTLLMLITVTFTLSVSLFGTRLAGHWAAMPASPFSLLNYCQLAAVISALAAFIGALGASFEEQHYFRHITFVDEET